MISSGLVNKDYIQFFKQPSGLQGKKSDTATDRIPAPARFTSLFLTAHPLCLG
jgi:hypothetical protein